MIGYGSNVFSMCLKAFLCFDSSDAITIKGVPCKRKFRYSEYIQFNSKSSVLKYVISFRKSTESLLTIVEAPVSNMILPRESHLKRIWVMWILTLVWFIHFIRSDHEIWSCSKFEYWKKFTCYHIIVGYNIKLLPFELYQIIAVNEFQPLNKLENAGPSL